MNPVSDHSDSKAHTGAVKNVKYNALYQACAASAVAANDCAKACANEKDASKLALCIRLDKDAAAISRATLDLRTRSDASDPVLKLLVEACWKATAACAVECEKHAAHMAHCKTCAEACRATEKACSTFA